ncbi:hypothetical protein ACOMHN_045426 [Nucella lapillus]
MLQEPRESLKSEAAFASVHRSRAVQPFLPLYSNPDGPEVVGRAASANPDPRFPRPVDAVDSRRVVVSMIRQRGRLDGARSS